MLQFFSKTRTLTGLILLLSPLISVLSSGWPASFWPPFFCSMLFSLLPLRAAMKHLPFSFWLLMCSIFSAAGMLSASLQNPHIAGLLPPIFLGCSSCGILLLLPPWLAVGRYVYASPFLGLAWSGSIAAAMLLHLLMQYFPQVSILLFVLPTAAGLCLCSRRLPQNQLLQQPPHDFFGSSMVKAVVFLLALLTSMGICACVLLPKSSAVPDFTLLSSVFFACGPVLSSCFTEKKGIYSSCIFSIFLTEMALLLTFAQSSFFLAAGFAALCLAAGSTAVILPVLSFYLCGRTGYIRGLTPLLLCVPVSLLFSWPFRSMAVRGELIQQDTAAFLFFLLIMSFLCIFFAWKHRFIILKNSKI